MAELFVARTQEEGGEDLECVVKRILPSFSEDEAFVKMFIDEASLTSKLQHQNIVRIFDFDVSDRQYYIAMEFIRGEDLQTIVKDGLDKGMPLTVPLAVRIVIELANGLHYAHTKEHKGKPLNIIHRDISPHNAMVSYAGDVKLMDFGIAKAAERSTKTQAGMVKGKVAYMSPEQARGKPLDPRSDLFALATVLWELITNKRLFLRSSDFETLTAILKEEPDPPSRHRKEVDPELDQIIMAALDKDREKRQANVETFARELSRWFHKHVDPRRGEDLGAYMRRLYAEKVAKLEGPPREAKSERAERTPGRSTDVYGAQNAAMTFEASVPDVLNSAPPKRAQRGAENFADAATLLEDSISQEALARALAESRKKRTEDGANAANAAHAVKPQEGKRADAQLRRPGPASAPAAASSAGRGTLYALIGGAVVVGGVVAFLLLR
jgi:serine/threonine protein kinase